MADGLIRTLVNLALHNHGPEKGVAWLMQPDTVTQALLIAGVALRLADEPERRGVKNGTGVYI